MEKCTFCIQRIRRTSRDAKNSGEAIADDSRQLNPACVNACPTDTLVFGDQNNSDSKVAKLKEKEMGHDGRGYRMFEELGTEPNVIYLKKVDQNAKEPAHG